jgi:hypothetical protein
MYVCAYDTMYGMRHMYLSICCVTYIVLSGHVGPLLQEEGADSCVAIMGGQMKGRMAILQ